MSSQVTPPHTPFNIQLLIETRVDLKENGQFFKYDEDRIREIPEVICVEDGEVTFQHQKSYNIVVGNNVLETFRYPTDGITQYLMDHSIREEVCDQVTNQLSSHIQNTGVPYPENEDHDYYYFRYCLESEDDRIFTQKKKVHRWKDLDHEIYYDENSQTLTSLPD